MLLLRSMLFLLSLVFATVIIRRVALMVVSGPHTMKYYDIDDEDVYISCGVGVECLLESVGESPRGDFLLY